MLVNNLSMLSGPLSSLRPKKKWYRRFVKRSAVALILREREQRLEVLMIKRADRIGDPWSGHMAFPGGRAEAGDQNNLATACRETLEEIGLDTGAHTRVLGRLSDVVSRSHRGRAMMVVTPYLLSIEEVPALTPNHEVAEVIWVPLNFLADNTNRQTMEWKIKKVKLKLPCYFFQQRRIWGLSLIMLDELLKTIGEKSR